MIADGRFSRKPQGPPGQPASRRPSILTDSHNNRPIVDKPRCRGGAGPIRLLWSGAGMAWTMARTRAKPDQFEGNAMRITAGLVFAGAGSLCGSTAATAHDPPPPAPPAPRAAPPPAA